MADELDALVDAIRVDLQGRGNGVPSRPAIKRVLLAQARVLAADRVRWEAEQQRHAATTEPQEGDFVIHPDFTVHLEGDDASYPQMTIYDGDNYNEAVLKIYQATIDLPMSRYNIREGTPVVWDVSEGGDYSRVDWDLTLKLALSIQQAEDQGR